MVDIDNEGFRFHCCAFAKSGGSDGKAAIQGAGFSFVQISDSHIGFNKPANPDVTATLQSAIKTINALPIRRTSSFTRAI